MSSNNDHSPSAKTSKDDLLDELESIKGLLDDELEMDIPILDDVVDSVAASDTREDDQATTLLDLNTIFDDEVDNASTEAQSEDSLNPATNITIPNFKLDTAAIENEDQATGDNEAQLSPEDPDYEEEQEEMFAEHEMAPSSEPAMADSDLNVDLLIQEIVDEFIPAIEDELRQRLSQCSPAVIKQLAEKHLKD